MFVAGDGEGRTRQQMPEAFGREAVAAGFGIGAVFACELGDDRRFRRVTVTDADRVYSGVPAEMVGRHQEIEVGPMSGESNVVFWLESRDIPATPERIQAVFQHAKSVDRVLRDDEIRGVLASLDATKVS